MRRVIRLVAGIGVALLGVPGAPVAPCQVAAQPAAYSAAPIRGWVVDAETRQPLEGVHVVAQWILNTGLFFHAERVQRLHIMETVTDPGGEYRFPAWGPKPRPALARLDGDDPRLTFFRPGYRPLDRSNNDVEAGALLTSRWDGKTIALEPFRGTPEQWVTALQLVQVRLRWGSPEHHLSQAPNEYWRHFPRIVLAVLDQRRLLPDSLRYSVSDLRGWNVTEEELRNLAAQEGRVQ